MKKLAILLALLACHSHQEIRAEETLQETTTKTETVDSGPEHVVVVERFYAPAPLRAPGASGAVPRPPGVSGSVPPAVPATGDLIAERITTTDIGPKKDTIVVGDNKTEKLDLKKKSDTKPSAGCTSAAILWALAVLAGLGLAGFALKKLS